MGPRIAVTVVFAIGLIYFGLVLNTFRVWSGVQISAPDNFSDGPLGSGMSNEVTPVFNQGKDGIPLPKINHEGLAEAEKEDGLAALASLNRSRETRDQRMRDLERGLGGIDDGDAEDDRASNRSALGLVLAPSGDQPKGSPGQNLLVPQVTQTPPLMAMSRLPSSLAQGEIAPPGFGMSPPLTARDPYMNLAGEASEPIRLPPSRDENAYPFMQRDPLGIHDDSIGADPRFLNISRAFIDPQAEKAEGNVAQWGMKQDRDSLSTDSGKGKGRA
jgi:hypothetical protein